MNSNVEKVDKQPEKTCLYQLSFPTQRFCFSCSCRHETIKALFLTMSLIFGRNFILLTFQLDALVLLSALKKTRASIVKTLARQNFLPIKVAKKKAFHYFIPCLMFSEACRGSCDMTYQMLYALSLSCDSIITLHSFPGVH